MSIKDKAPFAPLSGWGEWFFYDGLALGLRLYFFYWLLLAVFRGLFIIGMAEYMTPATGGGDIWLAMERGFCLSMQTAGILTLVSWGPAFLLTPPAARLGRLWLRLSSALTLAGLSILFVARFPYYRQFHSSYHQILFNTMNDDVYALLLSLVQEFYLPLRLAAALLLAYGLYRLLWRLAAPCPPPPHRSDSPAGRWLRRGALLAALCLLARLSYYGGAWSWEGAVNWENSGVTRDTLLNEAILDDGQALFRAYTLNSRLLACNGLDFSPAEIRRLAAKLADRPADTADLDVYLTRTAGGAQLEKPRHIFLIIGESYANWPFLPQYADLHIADGLKAIIERPDSAYCGAFLPNGGATVSAVTGVVTGLADANLYLTTMPESFAAPYPTASAPILKRLGYATYFWYAGPATWERVGDFVTAQGYDHFISSGNIAAGGGSVWGVDDEYLYRAVLDGLREDEPQFHVILNVSNHSPFAVDLEAQGFDPAPRRAALPPDLREDTALLRQLGHYWYADRQLAHFIGAARQRFPDSLFLVIGDHADRYNVSRTPGLHERFAIPFIITGAGVTPQLLPPQAAGSQIDVVPTLVEMIAPAGFTYMSLGQSLSRGNERGVNYMLWITHDAIGKTDLSPLAPEPLTPGGAAPQVDAAAMEDYINAIRSISWWRAKHGAILDAAEPPQNSAGRRP